MAAIEPDKICNTADLCLLCHTLSNEAPKCGKENVNISNLGSS